MSPTVEYGVLDATPTPAVVDELVSLYETYGWWADRDPEALREALAETDELVWVRDDAGEDEVGEGTDDVGSGDVVAAARILTDYVYYAQVYDVVVDADRRGEGFGRVLVEGVADHPRLADVAPSLLAREGLVEFYERCGFEDPGAIERPGGDAEPLTWLVSRDDGEENGDS